MVEKSVEMVNENPGYLKARASLKNSKPLAEVVGEPVELGDFAEIHADDQADQDGYAV